MPAATLSTMGADGPRAITTEEIFADKVVVLFAVPGAFTPTCSDEHLPGFLARGDELRHCGVDRVVCLAVNDAHVMGAWAKARGVGDSILMLADGNGDLTRAMGLEVDLSRFGMGIRSRRYAAVVDDGQLRWLQVEPASGVTLSGAEAVLARLRS
ncbi:MAG: peroxiredoxin [Thermoanaerobaculia bacterium]